MHRSCCSICAGSCFLVSFPKVYSKLWTRPAGLSHMTGRGDTGLGAVKPTADPSGTEAEPVGVEVGIEQLTSPTRSTLWLILWRYSFVGPMHSTLAARIYLFMLQIIFTFFFFFCNWELPYFWQDTSRNLSKVDRMLGQYREHSDEQAEAMALVRQLLFCIDLYSLYLTLYSLNPIAEMFFLVFWSLTLSLSFRVDQLR